MYTLGRGVVHGGGFGLAVAVVDTWVRAAALLGGHHLPEVRVLVHAALADVATGTCLGVLCAWPLGLRRHGLLLHRLATAAAWGVVGALGLPAGRPELAIVVSPVAALGLLPLADWLGFRWRWDPILLGALAIAAGIALPAFSGR